SRIAASVRAEITHGTTASGCSTGTGGGLLGGACSSTTCAFVPLMPKDDTAQRRDRSLSGHSACSVSSASAADLQSTWDEGVSTCNVLGSTPLRSASTILIRPATPAVCCV